MVARTRTFLWLVTPGVLVALLAAGITLGIGLSTASGGQTTTAGSGAPQARGGIPSFSFTGGIDYRGAGGEGKTFYKVAALHVRYSGSGAVTLAGDSGGTTDTLVDDVLILKVVRPNGTTASFKHDYSDGCGSLTDLPPQDMSGMFRTGKNDVILTLKDKCGGEVFSSALWMVG